MKKDELIQKYQQLVFQYGELNLKGVEIDTIKKDIEKQIGESVAKIKEILAEEKKEADAKKEEPKPVDPIHLVKEDENTELGRS